MPSGLQLWLIIGELFVVSALVTGELQKATDDMRRQYPHVSDNGHMLTACAAFAFAIALGPLLPVFALIFAITGKIGRGK